MGQEKCIEEYDVIVVGAGASGMFCAMEAAKRKRKVLIIESSNKPGKKILMSGGGYCNFTNYNISADCFISNNKHFCKSALSRYTQWDFIKLVEKYNIPYHEKTLGQLFCDVKAKVIVQMLLSECDNNNVTIKLNTTILQVSQTQDNNYLLVAENSNFTCESLVVATGGLSIPTLGATAFGYNLAKQFNIKVWPTKAALVPFTLQPHDKERFSQLSGVSFAATVSNKKISFDEGCLLTHRGISGPAILQVSSYWNPGETIDINALPGNDLMKILSGAKLNKITKSVKTVLSDFLPKRLVDALLGCEAAQITCSSMDLNSIKQIANAVHNWRLKPSGTEGYRTAEVTMGGVDCNAISSKTMQSTAHSGLYFIGEVLDVTGWLGGYNFQWAWSSGYAAGQYV